ncbi:MAG: cytochrome P450 [Betaproteobacteria bacterium]|jgi:cytochrome P450|nr:cytochrome P450 [Betaproteobacteria bacterium]NBP45145.1 cytochrome P450 [Betaproteobacteria bacterium]
MPHASDRLMAQSFELSALPAGFHDNPYAVYRALREHAPIKPMADGSYFLTRYDDLVAVYKDTRTFSSDKKIEFKPKYGDSLLYEHHTTSLVFSDPPLHTRVRKLISGALTPKAIASMENGLIELVDDLMDRMKAKALGGNTVDLIEDFASAIPIEVIGNLLGVPVDERGPLRDWSLAILGALEPVLTPEQFQRGNAAVAEFVDYLTGLIARRRAAPGQPDTDVLTRLIQGEADGETLSAKELLHNCIFLLNAGHETTTNLIGNGLVCLHDHPQARARLIEQPELIKTAIEEMLRYESSNQLGNRITTQAVNLGGVAMPAGTRLTLCIGAANRDPAQFEDPETFDVGRQPNRHLAFASGAHACAGMSLARLEGQIAIGRWLKRFPDFTLAGAPVRGGRVRFRGYLRVPAHL